MKKAFKTHIQYIFEKVGKNFDVSCRVFRQTIVSVRKKEFTKTVVKEEKRRT